MPSNPLTPEEIIAYGKRQNYPAGRFLSTNPSNPSGMGWWDIEEYLTDLGYSPSGETEKTWMDLVRGWKIEPTLNTTIVGGEVWNYVYQSSPSDVTYYRYIANDGSEDSFYANFNGTELSNLVKKREILI